MRSMGKKGFTLVEIIVVMVVVGILAAITVPSLGKYIDNGKKRDCEINRKALLARLESDRALAPGVTMAEVLAENTDISCPSGGVYSAPDDNTVECSVHGKDSALSAVEEGVGGELVEISEVESELPGDEGTLMPTTESESNEDNYIPPFGEDGCLIRMGVDNNYVGFPYYSINKLLSEKYIPDSNVSISLTPGRIWFDELRGEFYYISYAGPEVIKIKYNNGKYDYELTKGYGNNYINKVSESILTSSELEQKLSIGPYRIEGGTLFYNEGVYYIAKEPVNIGKGENNWKEHKWIFVQMTLCSNE
nr:prepilin-type N-terminal cleavage/methylation domain-containing protein [uncultured Eisenbergiella sp.]